ncbi:MAG TPA: ABC transporter permease [Gemmatimonadales bacterium]
MTLWLVRRVLAAIAIVFAVVTLIFFAIHAAPGTPFLPGGDRHLDPVLVASLRARFGLDQPLPMQFAHYLSALVRGDMGESFRLQLPVKDALAAAIPNTVLLAAAALTIDFLLGIVIGAWQAARAREGSDAALTAVMLFGYSLPTFWLGLVLLLLLGDWIHLFPIGGAIDPVFHGSMSLGGRVLDRLRHLALPALTLGLVGAAGTARFQRAAMLNALERAFVRTARAKGLAEPVVLIRHALSNALLPTITLLGLALPFLLTGSVVVETVFAWPGMGKLAADAIASRDYPMVMATALVASIMVVIGNLFADLLYAAADPRVRPT